MVKTDVHTEVAIPPLGLIGDLVIPEGARAMVVFAHGSGSSRLSPRNRAVAHMLSDAGMATLLFDLLSETEARNRVNVFDIGLLADRLVDTIDWIGGERTLARMRIGLFGASTGAAAALRAAAFRPKAVGAVVSRGGRPDLAGAALAELKAATLLIVGGNDTEVLALNRYAQARMTCPTRLDIIPGAGHLFEEPGALEDAGRRATAWFAKHLDGETGVRP